MDKADLGDQGGLRSELAGPGMNRPSVPVAPDALFFLGFCLMIWIGRRGNRGRRMAASVIPVDGRLTGFADGVVYTAVAFHQKSL